MVTENTVWVRSGGSWVHLSERQKFLDSSFNPSPKNLAGFFLTEVFSTHAWQVNIDNLTIYMCENNEAPCSGL